MPGARSVFAVSRLTLGGAHYRRNVLYLLRLAAIPSPVPGVTTTCLIS